MRKLTALKAWLVDFGDDTCGLFFGVPRGKKKGTPGLFFTDSQFDVMVERVTGMARDESGVSGDMDQYEIDWTKSPAEIIEQIRKELVHD